MGRTLLRSPRAHGKRSQRVSLDGDGRTRWQDGDAVYSESSDGEDDYIFQDGDVESSESGYSDGTASPRRPAT